MEEREVNALLKAAKSLAPPGSKKAKREPFTPTQIIAICNHLDLDSPLDSAVFACLTTCFYSCARLGEFTIPTLSSFETSRHISPSLVFEAVDRWNNRVKKFKLPFTKTSQAGEDVFWSTQAGLSDPRAAFENHLRVNEPPHLGPLFAYRHGLGHRPLTKGEFLSRLTSASTSAGLTPLQGHSIRIGGTLEYLLRGMPFDVVKTMGRWSSDAFTGYLRRHAQVLAPYLQDKPEVHDQFIRLAMPRPRS